MLDDRLPGRRFCQHVAILVKHLCETKFVSTGRVGLEVLRFVRSLPTRRHALYPTRRLRPLPPCLWPPLLPTAAVAVAGIFTIVCTVLLCLMNL